MTVRETIKLLHRIVENDTKRNKYWKNESEKQTQVLKYMSTQDEMAKNVVNQDH